MGLQGTESSHLNAKIRAQGTNPFPTSPPPTKQQDQPYPHIKPNYGAHTQYAQGEDVSPALDKVGKKFIQEVCGVFLFLPRMVDGGLLPALSSLASQQANPTEKNNVIVLEIL